MSEKIFEHSASFFEQGVRRMLVAGVSATLLLTLTACAASSATKTEDAMATATQAVGEGDVAAGTSTDGSSGGEIYEVAKAFSIDTASLFSKRDQDASYSAESATKIALRDSGTTVTGEGAVVEGSQVTINSQGTYVLSGTLSDGRIVVDVADDEKVQIVLSGASVTSSGPCALYVRNADKIFLTLEGTDNLLASSGADTQEDDHTLDGAIFSSADLTANGSGALSVKSGQGSGIVAKDELTLCGGTVTVEGAVHAVEAKDSLAANAGTYTLTADTNDAIHVEHDTNGEKGFVYISGGSFTLTAADDGIHASNDILIDGGSFKIAAADDGIHSEYDLVVNDGTIDVTESHEGIEGATIVQNGGTIDAVASDDGANATGYPTAEKDARTQEMSGMGEGGWSEERPDMDDLMEKGQREGELTTTDGQSQQTDPSAGATDTAQSQMPEQDRSMMGEGQGEAPQPPMMDGQGQGGPMGGQSMPEPPAMGEGQPGQGGPQGAGPGMTGDEVAPETLESTQEGTNPSEGDAAAQEGTATAMPGEGSNQSRHLFGGGGGRGMMMDVDETADITVNGGILRIDAGGDGLDSNGTIHIQGGEVYVSGPTNDGNTAIDAGTDIVVTGGILVASGSSGMVEPFSSDCTQGTMVVGVSGEAGEAITLTDAAGTTIASFSPAKAYQCVEISAPAIKQGETYTLTAGGETKTIQMDELAYSDVTSMMMGGMGAGGFGRERDAANATELT